MVGIIKGKAFGSHPEVISGISQYHKYAYVHLICAEDCNHYDDQPMTERTHWEFRPSDFLSMFFFFFFAFDWDGTSLTPLWTTAFVRLFFMLPAKAKRFMLRLLTGLYSYRTAKKIRLRGNKLPASQGAEKKAKKKKSSYIKRNGTFRNATRSRSCPQDKGAIKCVLPNLPLNVGYWKTETKTRKTRHRYLSAIMPEAH